jgi:hypothetical protein
MGLGEVGSGATDTGTADGYQNVKRASRAYEELRLR